VVGAGPVGSRRAATLHEAGAKVLVVAPDVSASVVALVEGGSVELARRPFEPADLDGALLVVAATGDRSVDDAVSVAAGARGVLAFPALVRRGPVRLAVDSGGTAPAVSRLVADMVDGALDEVLGLDADGLTLLVQVVAEVRAQLAGAPGGSGGGALDWRSALDGSILELIRQGREAEAKERLLACLSSS
jgi:siroheme synthase-like protein